MNHRRNEFEVYRDILGLCREESGKTRIVYKANLNFKIVRKFLEWLLDRKMLKQTGKKFVITDKGVAYVEQLESVINP